MRALIVGLLAACLSLPMSALCHSQQAKVDQQSIVLRNNVSLSGRTDDVLKFLTEFHSKNDSAASGSQIHLIVQFQKKLDAEQLAILKANKIVLHAPVGPNAYLSTVRFPKELNEEMLEALDEVPIRALHLLPPEAKKSTSLFKGNPLAEAVDAKSGNVRLIVTFFPGISKRRVRKLLASIGVDGKFHAVANSWKVVVAKKKLNEITSLNGVLFVCEGPLKPTELNSKVRLSTNVDIVQNASFSYLPPTYGGLSGKKVVVGICEPSGFNHNHVGFFDVLANGNPSVSRVSPKYCSGSCGHGTSVASVLAGNGANKTSVGAFQFRGHAPEAKLGSYRHFANDPAQTYRALVSDSCDVTNHSYADGCRDGSYDSIATGLDAIIRGDATHGRRSIPARPQVWSIGNNGLAPEYGHMKGYYSAFTTSKNVISVGSIDSDGKVISEFSALGPTYDGRVKPELVAASVHRSLSRTHPKSITAASQFANDKYATTTPGTSLSAPVVTGIIALMRQQHAKRAMRHRMLPSTYKAMLIYSAVDLLKTSPLYHDFSNPDTGKPVLYHRGPDFATGYGAVNALGATQVVSAVSQWKEARHSKVGDKHVYCLKVPEGSGPLKVVLAWDDKPSVPCVGQTYRALVNDLDLVLIDPDRKPHDPWVLIPPPVAANPSTNGIDPILPADIKPAKPGTDRTNNVEMVTVDRPLAGKWELSVDAYKLLDSQSYSLVASVPITQCVDEADDTPLNLTPVRLVDDKIIVDPRGPVPVDVILRYVPDIKSKPKPLRFDYVIRLSGIPITDGEPGNVVLVGLDESSEIDVNPDGTALVQVPNPVAGEPKSLMFTDSAGDTLQQPFPLAVSVLKHKKRKKRSLVK